MFAFILSILLALPTPRDIDKMLGVAYGEQNQDKIGFFLTYCTMLNRLERGYGNGQVEPMLSAYYAKWKEYPTEWAEYALEKDCPGNILYALSYQDVIHLGFKHSDADFVAGDSYFYSKWGN